MNQHNSGGMPFRLILLVAAFVLFTINAVTWLEPWPWRNRLLSAGLACLVASMFFSN
jgi:hypothetical protein